MNQLIRKGGAAAVLVPLPRDLKPTTIGAQLYGASDGVAMWDSRKDIDHPFWACTQTLPAGSTGFTVTDWGDDRVPQPGEELLLFENTTAAASAQRPRENVIVDYVDDLNVYLRESTVRAWDNFYLTPKVIRVPLAAVDLQNTGRCYRIEVRCVYANMPGNDEDEQFATALMDVVRHVPRCTLTLSTLQGTYPNLFAKLAGSLSRESGGWDELRERAFALVLADVSRTISPDFIYSDSDLEMPTIQRMLLMRAEDGNLYRENQDRLGVVQYQQGQYDRALTEALSSMGWVDRDGDEIPDEDEKRVSLIQRCAFTM